MKICSIILGAGKGSRMLSSTPKPLHTISGKSMIQWVMDANKSAGIKKSVIVVPQEFDKVDINNSPEDLNYWLDRWIDAYSYVLSLMKNKLPNSLLICFERLCEDEKYWQQVCKKLDVTTISSPFIRSQKIRTKIKLNRLQEALRIYKQLLELSNID